MTCVARQSPGKQLVNMNFKQTMVAARQTSHRISVSAVQERCLGQRSLR